MRYCIANISFYIQGGPQKVSHYKIIEKFVLRRIKACHWDDWG